MNLGQLFLLTQACEQGSWQEGGRIPWNWTRNSSNFKVRASAFLSQLHLPGRYRHVMTTAANSQQERKKEDGKHIDDLHTFPHYRRCTPRRRSGLRLGSSTKDSEAPSSILFLCNISSSRTSCRLGKRPKVLDGSPSPHCGIKSLLVWSEISKDLLERTKVDVQVGKK